MGLNLSDNGMFGVFADKAQLEDVPSGSPKTAAEPQPGNTTGGNGNKWEVKNRSS